MNLKATIGDALSSPFVRAGVILVAALTSQMAHAQNTSAPKALQDLLGISPRQAVTLANTPKIQKCFDQAFKAFDAKSRVGLATIDNMTCQVEVYDNNGQRNGNAALQVSGETGSSFENTNINLSTIGNSSHDDIQIEAAGRYRYELQRDANEGNGPLGPVVKQVQYEKNLAQKFASKAKL